jgi:DNA-binding transcriptional LysR family regulator
MRGFSLDQLQTLVHVIEKGSFSAAADRLDVSQPAVSHQIRQLEKRLGLRLLERVGRRTTPTAAGLELLAHVRQINAVVSATTEAMSRHASGAIGRVRIGTGATACIYFLPRILRDLRAKFPSLDIIVRTGNTPDILKAIEENTVDVGLVTLPAPGRMFDVRPVLRDELVAIADRGAMQLPAKVTPLVLAKVPMVVYETGANTRGLIDNWFVRSGLSVKPAMELGSVEAIKELVGAGLGCGIVPRMSIPKAHNAKLVVRSLSPALQRKLAIVLRRDKPLNKGLREVLSAVTQAAATH